MQLSCASVGFLLSAGQVELAWCTSVALHRCGDCARLQAGGRRYWTQRLGGAEHDATLQALCDRGAALFVKKRASALAYRDDPTGVRSLLATLISPAASSGSGTGGTSGHDLVEVCSAFSSDPFVTSFVLAFCAPGPGTSPASAPPDTGRGPGHLQRADRFLRHAFSTCVLQEQTHLLPPLYLQAFFLCQVRGCPPAVTSRREVPRLHGA